MLILNTHINTSFINSLTLKKIHGCIDDRKDIIIGFVNDTRDIIGKKQFFTKVVYYKNILWTLYLILSYNVEVLKKNNLWK